MVDIVNEPGQKTVDLYSVRQKVLCLRMLIDEVERNDFSDECFVQILLDYESGLNLFLVERRGCRTILRHGNGRELVLMNHDFRRELSWNDWCSYVSERKRACVNVLEEMLLTTKAAM